MFVDHEAHVAVARGDRDEVVRAEALLARVGRDELRRGVHVHARSCRRVGVGDLGHARLVVADVDARLDGKRVPVGGDGVEGERRVVRERRREVRHRVGVVVVVVVANWPKPRSAKPCQSRSWFGAAEAGLVGGEHRVPRLEDGRVPRHQHHRVVVELDPAPVTRALRRPRPGRARTAMSSCGALRRVAGQEQLAECRTAPRPRSRRRRAPRGRRCRTRSRRG